MKTAKAIFSPIITKGAFLLLAGTLTHQSYAAPEVHFDQCQQPFTYNGDQYLGTTNRNNFGNQWCYLKTPVNGSTPIVMATTGKIAISVTKPSKFSRTHNPNQLI